MNRIETKDDLIAHLARHKFPPALVNGDLHDDDVSIFMADLNGVLYPVFYGIGRNAGSVLGEVAIIRRGRAQFVAISNSLWVHLLYNAKLEAACDSGA